MHLIVLIPIRMQPKYVRQLPSAPTMVDYGSVGVDKTNDLELLSYAPFVSLHEFPFLLHKYRAGFKLHKWLSLPHSLDNP